MLLRSSSTPVLGSLLSSFSESPNNHHHYHRPEITLTTHKHSPIPPTYNKPVSFHQTAGSHNLTTFSCNSSPISPSINNNGFHRAQSEGNLESLVNSSSNDDEFRFFNPPKKFSSRLSSSNLLETIPSFSFHNSRNMYEDEYSDEDEEDEDEEEDEEFREYGDLFGNNTIRSEERFEAANFSAINTEEEKIMVLNEEMRYVTDDYGNEVLKDKMIGEGSRQMYLARGHGVDTDFRSGGGGIAGGAAGGGNFTQVTFDKDGGGDSHGVAEHYKKMANENPGNPLLLRNYAQFLYQSKQDLQGAEEYYSRAVLADPNDGEILSQYAKLLWELHHDKDRALGYLERAIQAASEDSHVHAAYASFLWEIEEEEDEDEDHVRNDSYVMPPLHRQGAMASATAF